MYTEFNESGSWHNESTGMEWTDEEVSGWKYASDVVYDAFNGGRP